MLRIALVSLIFSVVLADVANAQQCPAFPYTLSNGSPADATQAMADFNNLRNCPALATNPFFTGDFTLQTPNVAYNSAFIINTPATGEQAAFALESNGTGKWQFGKNVDDSFFLWDTAATRLDVLVIPNGNMGLMPSGGNVGIGTTTPSYLLQVNGTAYAAGAAGALSDVRHKKDITLLTDGALAEVLQLRPVAFPGEIPQTTG